MKKRHSITISPEASDRAHQLATEQKRSFSNLVEVALERLVRDGSGKYELPKNGLSVGEKENNY